MIDNKLHAEINPHLPKLLLVTVFITATEMLAIRHTVCESHPKRKWDVHGAQSVHKLGQMHTVHKVNCTQWEASMVKVCT